MRDRKCYECGEKKWTVRCVPDEYTIVVQSAWSDAAKPWYALDPLVDAADFGGNKPYYIKILTWFQVLLAAAMPPEVAVEMLHAGHYDQLHELLFSVGGTLCLSRLPGRMGVNAEHRVICATSDFPSWAVEVAKGWEGSDDAGQYPLLQLDLNRDFVTLGGQR